MPLHKNTCIWYFSALRARTARQFSPRWHTFSSHLAAQRAVIPKKSTKASVFYSAVVNQCQRSVIQGLVITLGVISRLSSGARPTHAYAQKTPFGSWTPTSARIGCKPPPHKHNPAGGLRRFKYLEAAPKKEITADAIRGNNQKILKQSSTHSWLMK